jgi:hypothetical protein
MFKNSKKILYIEEEIKMKKLISKVREKGYEFWGRTALATGTLITAATPVLAATELKWSMPDQLKSVITFLGGALQFLGIGIILFGAIQIAFAFRSDDAEGKSKGLRAAVSGALVWAIGLAASAFVVETPQAV